ncbi:hypothetical protein [Leptospira ilyithenensis]|uniref:Scramblase n=1 Tax=Leptospira ilyithenensis TaxID=2484901 RepID=A0A4V3JX96_9LEPT|nr:hypothetical protein [Leptospira ilyithenensis]TGN10451.1 hypothetical protein EHS11_09165 [Leptospira ilyithenensis]
MDAFNNDKYFAKMVFFKLFGNTIRIFDEKKTTLLLFVKQKAFKFKEDITVFSDETETKSLLKISARNIIDFGATYDVTDSVSGGKIGALRRKGMMSSFVMDAWEILDSNDTVIGKIEEDNWILALIRRYLINFLPQKFQFYLNDKAVGFVEQTWNPFLPQMKVDFSMDSGKHLNRKLGLAAVVLLQVVEGKQN